MNSVFDFEPASFVPFRDKIEVARVRALTREQLNQHPNPDYRIQIVADEEVEDLWIADILERLRHSCLADEPLVMLMPNPCPSYSKLAERINRERISLRNVHTFNLDEYADQDGRVAPHDWEFGFGQSFLRFFISKIDAKLRPPAGQVHLLSNETLAHYSRMIDDMGGADIAYVGPGWTGHLGFVDPDSPEFFASTLDEWKKFETRICTLSPFTIAQNSLHGCFGASGDLTAVPPKAATVGPREILAAKERFSVHGIGIGGGFHSWQRLTSRLVMHGPVTHLVPESVLQTTKTRTLVTETIAAPIETRWDLGY